MKRWICEFCGEVAADSQVLVAPNPFDRDDDIRGCPTCRSVETLTYLCETPNCNLAASMGTPTPRGYRVTCWKHRPNKDRDA